MPKSPLTTQQAQTVLARRLQRLAPTGDLGFEGLLAEALSEFTGQPFHLAKSGHQEGTDVRSAPYNLFRIGLEAKRYRPSSSLPLDALLYKITDAAAARQPVDLWILAATRAISASNREQLHLHGERCGIGVLVLDWPHKPTRLCDLAVICGAAPRTCQEILKPTAHVSKALRVIQSDVEFEQIRSQIFKHLTRADVGYANARHASERWMVEAQASLANAKSRIGGHHNLRESEFGVVSRTAINTQLDNWYTSGHGFAALLGDEGTGKSWAVLDWHERLRSSAAGAPLLVFLRATAIDASKDVKSAIAHALSTQTSVGLISFWEKRLQLWESCQGDGVPILVLIDGLNENFHFTDWADWLQPLFEDHLVGMYRVIVSCWPDWWRSSLSGMVNLVPQPQEIPVERFGESELDYLLAAMTLSRSDFAPAVLELMRVPRLSSLVMTHRDRLKDSGDVTAERVIYEDWKDRLRRSGPNVGLSDEEMKTFIADLGQKLQLHLDRAMTRGEVVKSLSDESGKAVSDLQGAVAALASGGWLQPGNKPNTFMVKKDRVPYALAAALMANVYENSDAAILEAKIADFLDPLKAHSLGASILRAATTISLIETQATAVCRKVIMSKWLEEQNFHVGDFDAFWRLLGIQPELVFDLAEEWWLVRRGRTFTDEALIKALANAAIFPEFREALKLRLARWLGTAWPDPRVGEFLGKVDATSLEARHRVQNTQARHTHWVSSASAKAFVSIRLDDSECDWSWLSARALAILSYLDRAPFTMAFEAWALSRAAMERPRHGEQLAWVLRLNMNDHNEASKPLCELVQRFGDHDHPVCQLASDYLTAAISHVQRADAPLVVQDNHDDDTVSGFQVSAMSRSEVVEATQKYLLPYAWKTSDPGTAAELVNAFILGMSDDDADDIDLILDHLRDLLIILTPDSRARIRQAISTKIAEQANKSENDKPRDYRLQSGLLLLQLYDAKPHEQSNLILNGNIGSEMDDWIPMLRALTLADVGQPDFDGASDADVSGWLDYICERVPREQLKKLEFLPQLVANNDISIRSAALRVAIHGHHISALEAFSESSHSRPVVAKDKANREHEYLRNRALLELYDFAPPKVVADELSRESAALIANDKPDDAEAIERFHQYVREEFDALTNQRSWSSPRYWRSYKETLDTLVANDLDSILRWLRPWLAQPGRHLERALMDHFPVIDLMQALSSPAPEVSIELYRLLVGHTKGGMVSSDGLKSFPFLMPTSKDTDELCIQQLTEAVDDKALSEIAYFSYKYERTDWLLDAIEELESSKRPIDVAKAYTILGFSDENSRADALWQRFLSRPSTDPWLENVLRISIADYRANQSARGAFADLWNSDSAAVARHSLKRVMDKCDMRIGLWIDKIEPRWEQCAYDRSLVRNWATSEFNAAVRKRRDAGKKEFLRTALPFSNMSPWR